MRIAKRKQILKNKNNLRDLWDNIKGTSIHLIGVPERGEREKSVENVNVELHLEASKAGTFPRLRLGHEPRGQCWETASHSCSFQPSLSSLLQEQASVHVLLRTGVQASHSPSVSRTSTPTSQGGSSSLCRTPGKG